MAGIGHRYSQALFQFHLFHYTYILIKSAFQLLIKRLVHLVHLTRMLRDHMIKLISQELQASIGEIPKVFEKLVVILRHEI